MDSFFPNIDSELEKRNMNYRDLARVIGISDLAMYRRMAGITKWTLHEAIKITWFFNGVDIYRLFEKKGGDDKFV